MCHKKVRDYFMGQLFVMFAVVCVRLEGSYLYCISELTPDPSNEIQTRLIRISWPNLTSIRCIAIILCQPGNLTQDRDIQQMPTPRSYLTSSSCVDYFKL